MSKRLALGTALLLALVGAIALTACTEVVRTRQEGTRRGNFLKEKTQVALLTESFRDQKVIVVDIDRGAVRTVSVPILGHFSPFGFVVKDQIITMEEDPSSGTESPIRKAYAVPMGLDRPSKLLGIADQSFPSFTPGRVWLQRNQKQKDGSYRDFLWEVDLSGQQTASYEMPEGRSVIFPAPPAIQAGILTSFDVYDESEDDQSNFDGYGYDLAGGETYLEVWDPATNKTVRRLNGAEEFVAADRRTAVLHEFFPIDGNQGSYKVKTPSCGTRCPIHLVDVVTGKDRQVPLPAGIKGVSAEALFSPDGRSLAVSLEDLADDEAGLGIGIVGNLFIIDIATGQATKIFNASDVARIGAWSPDGKWFFFSRYNQLHQPGRIGVYRLGERHAKSLDLRLEENFPLLAIPSRFIR